MARTMISTKRVQISKASAQMVAIVGVAAFLSIFSLIASQAIFSNNKYQARVIKQKEIANDQLDADMKAFASLSDSYKKFENESPNVIGGQKTGSGDIDGSNPKIVLDALPNAYDFPALTSSLEKLLTDRNFKIASISGTDDQVNQQANLTSPTPQAVEIPFTFSVSGSNYASVQDLLTTLHRSIRPIQIDSLNVSGGSEDMTVTVKARTFYQPATNLNITKKVVK